MTSPGADAPDRTGEPDLVSARLTGLPRWPAPALLVLLAACSGGHGSPDPPDAYAPDIDPADFSTTIDNLYLPFEPWSTLRYDEWTDLGRVDATRGVTGNTREVMGVTCVVVHDVRLAVADGRTLEDAYRWYAQDTDGNVWYFGQETTSYEDGVPDTSGSWEAGVDGAQPGIVMLADPAVGDHYRQEYVAGEAEDQAVVVGLDESVTVAAGTYAHCVHTEEMTVLDPVRVEARWYAPGVGEVKAADQLGGEDTSELLSFTDWL